MNINKAAQKTIPNYFIINMPGDNILLDFQPFD